MNAYLPRFYSSATIAKGQSIHVLQGKTIHERRCRSIHESKVFNSLFRGEVLPFSAVVAVQFFRM